MLQRWAQKDHLKRFKVIITSLPEDRITQTFPDSISTHVNIPSGMDVKPSDSVSNDICAFLKKQLERTNMGDTWVNEALDYLVLCAAGMFIWAITVYDFLQKNPEQCFDILKTREHKCGADRFEELYSLYSTVIITSFHDLKEEEIQAFAFVISATIFAKQPLDDTMLMKLPGVNMLKFIRDSLVSVIDSSLILHFCHQSFKNFLLSESFWQYLPKLSGVQN